MDNFGIILGSVWDDFQIPIYFKRTYFMNHTNCLKLADLFRIFFDLSDFYKGFYFFQIKNPIYFLYNLLQLWTYFQKEMGTGSSEQYWIQYGRIQLVGRVASLGFEWA